MQPRQQPGIACEECRTRKLRCDRGLPCSNCRDAGVTCTINPARKPRGPERGLMKALQTRIAALEDRIERDTRTPNELLSPTSDKSPPQQPPSSTVAGAANSDMFEFPFPMSTISGSMDGAALGHPAIAAISQHNWTDNTQKWLPSPFSDGMSFDYASVGSSIASSHAGTPMTSLAPLQTIEMHPGLHQQTQTLEYALDAMKAELKDLRDEVLALGVRCDSLERETTATRSDIENLSSVRDRVKRALG